MLAKWVRDAMADIPVWLPDVRQELAKMPETVPVRMQLTLCNGGKRDFPLPIPRWEGEQQQRFVTEYVNASVFNVLAALSGRNLTFYVPPEEEQVASLIGELGQTFQVEQAKRTGYGKAVNVANRLCRAFSGEPFSFSVKPTEEFLSAPTGRKQKKTDLAARLRRIAKRAASGTYCGVDVGGTDIKLALSRDGKLACVKVLDWNPALSGAAEEIVNPISELIRQAAAEAADGALLDGLGISFPDVVIRDRIVGGETPKTRGMRENTALDYEREFAKLTELKAYLADLCKPGAQIRITNDGNMAAFTAAMELAHSGRDQVIEHGVIAHSLGTDLGTGWLDEEGLIPELPLELYDFLLDLGSWPSRERSTMDLRCVCNENSGLPGVRRYIGQAAAFRLAYRLKPELLDGFVVCNGDNVSIQEAPRDLRKPCLEWLMQCAQNGDPKAQEIFRKIGGNLGQISREMEFLLDPAAQTRFLFGRFVKMPCCFALLQEGCAAVAPQFALEAADDDLACTPLMLALSRSDDATVAQFGQAVGSIYFSLMEESWDETQ